MARGVGVAEGRAACPAATTASAVGHAMLHHRRRQFDRVWDVAKGLTDADLAAHIPVEAVDGALAAGSTEARQRALAIAAPTATMSAPVAVDLAGRLLAFAERDASAALVAELRGRPAIDLDERRRHTLTLIEGWLADRPARSRTGRCRSRSSTTARPITS